MSRLGKILLILVILAAVTVGVYAVARNSKKKDGSLKEVEVTQGTIVEKAVAGVTRALMGERVLLSARWQREKRRDGDPYQLLGGRALLRLPVGEIQLSGTNLADEEYLDVAGQPAAGRALTVGYRVELGR